MTKKSKSNKRSKLWYILLAETGLLFLLILTLTFQNFLIRSPQITPVPSSKSLTTFKAMKPATPTTALVVNKPSTQSAITIPAATGKSVRVPILMYHYIGNNPNPADTARYTLSTAPDVFDSQLGYLAKNGYTPISLDTLYAALQGGLLPPKPVVITIDDGYEDLFYNAYPIILKYHFHVTSFIPTSLMNQGYYLSWAQIKQMQSSGLFSFEAHSLTHPYLPGLSYDAQKQQIFESKKVLESETGAPVNFFAYPDGGSNATSWELVKEAGYFGAVGTWYGTSETTGDQFDWPRVRISGGISMADFASKL